MSEARTEPRRLYTISSPPEHRDGTTHQTKAEVEADEREHNGNHAQRKSMAMATLSG
jgi:hypothetical protein